MLNDLFHNVIEILVLMMDNPVYLFSTKGVRGGGDRSAEDAYSSAAPDPTFEFFWGPCSHTLDFVIAFWIMIMFYTLLTSLFCIGNRNQRIKDKQIPRQTRIIRKEKKM
jgi:ABC-type cobalt transport system substrate-binding protein